MWTKRLRIWIPPRLIPFSKIGSYGHQGYLSFLHTDPDISQHISKWVKIADADSITLTEA